MQHAVAVSRWSSRQWARQARDSNVAVLLRFAPEMNGDWRPWSVNDSPQDFIHAWRHLHDVFDQEGAGNVKWVFNPNVSFTGSVAIENFWPGADYVDWLGVDGYNWWGVKARCPTSFAARPALASGSPSGSSTTRRRTGVWQRRGS
jgi:beta-mannanase